ncbi:glycoside hydrolase family 2 protein [Natronobacterium gregoryi]|uniref:Beta-galactosidase/beta-glucuronidase n=2 Tax=Natronobacterium gregoryi TaxID=44930 RepID=L0AEP8_NATGS|nr:glycoside hydrolase family 2 [Natronobacterium gregoryi]AFZ71909.1 beta-galactosidase/beta-glucuronidase [Natronobacterium gregoryi SP2]ELY62470.1 glycoside hydrolase family protein [Natronobacterium gregoryi SP2]PLK20693.1 glycoside hydrolase family 2 [Natronobacterium gregoryi SP2]SFJ14213.1 beta-mannosidase [Natronobacterium gregoryi]
MTDEWSGGRVIDRERDGPPAVESWQPVSVPDRRPEFGDAGERGPIAYKTTIEEPRSSDDERAWLAVRGGYGRTTVWLDGERRGESAFGFVPVRFTFDPGQSSELIVVCEPPDAFTGIRGTDEVPSSLSTPSIRWGVDVESRPAAFIRRLETRPRLQHRDDDSTYGVLDIELEVDAGVAIDDAIRLTVRPNERGGSATMERVPVTAAAGERTTVSRTVELRDPSLWWPRGYGHQHRYSVRAKLGDDAAERLVGFRRVERDDEGLLVNGQRVRARGFTRLPGGDPVDDVTRALEANATLIRARAHVPDPAFHAACDEAGLLVWQDLPASGPEFAAGVADVVERGRELAATLAEEYGSHPSIVLYGAQDEPAAPFDAPVGSGITGRLAVRYRAWRTSVERQPAEEIAEAFPDDTPVVPVTGPVGTDPDGAHLSTGWEYLEASDLPWLLETYPSLVEVVGGLDAGSLVADADPAGVPGLNEDALARHETDPEASRIYQARTLKRGIETLRREGCGIFATAPIRDVAQGGGMGVTAADGEPKPAYEPVSDALEPVQAVLDEPPASGRAIGITVCNDTPAVLEATVEWAAGEESGEETLLADALGTSDAGALTVPADADVVELTVVADDRAATNRYRL